MENPSHQASIQVEEARATNVTRNPLEKFANLAQAGLDGFGESVGHMRVKMDKAQKNYRKKQRNSTRFRKNAEMAVRVACGVIVASFIQLRDQDYDPGGLSYCAVMVVFSMGANAGSTLREVCRGISGMGLAFIYNYILFMFIDVQAFDPSAENPYKNYYKIQKAFNSEAYWVNLPNVITTLPWMVLFTVATLLLPFNTNTRKFALGETRTSVLLTIISPANPLNPAELKLVGDAFFGTDNILRNLQVYTIVGIVGGLISVLTMLFPYPIIAIQQLNVEAQKASNDITGLLSIVVDTYCFTYKNVEQIKFHKLKLERKFNAIEARQRQMQSLLDDTWWEQCFGLHFLLHFNSEIMRKYVTLVGSLIGDLHTLNSAMRLEQYEWLHVTFMKVLQHEITTIQSLSSDLLTEIANGMLDPSSRFDLKAMEPLGNQVETTLYKYRKLQNRILRSQTVTPEEMARNMPLNLFLFSLNSFCSTLLNFKHSNNSNIYMVVNQVLSFMLNSSQAFVDPVYYSRPSTWLGAVKGSLAMMIGIFLAIHVYGFGATVPSTVAYVMGNYLGGSFRTTVNRVGGVVAGSVVPSVFKFFFVQVCNPSFLNDLLSRAGLFSWVSMSMYTYFVGEYSSYAGMVSAFISAVTLLRQTDLCYPNGSDSPGAIAISSYSSLAQTSVGVVIFIIVEIFIFPRSATSLLTRNILDTVNLQQRAFEVLFGHHLSTSVRMQDDTMAEVRNILEVQIPKKLVKRKRLLSEAQAEPLLWRSPFSRNKHERVLDISHQILNDVNLLFKLVCWFNFRVEQNRVTLGTLDIRDNPKGSIINNESSRWYVATNHFQSAVSDRFETIHKLYGDAFKYANPEHTARFMQMKEVFRIADRNCTGNLSRDDVSAMLQKIFAQSGAVKNGEMEKYVDEFMSIVSKGNATAISFNAFAEAVENGLKLEVEVFHRRKSRASSAGGRLERTQPEFNIPSMMSRARDNTSADNTEYRTALQNDGIRPIPFDADIAITVGRTGSTSDATSKLKESLVMQEYIEGDITRRVIGQRGSVVVEEVSLTISPNLPSNILECDDEDDTGAFFSDYASTPVRREHDVLEVDDVSSRDIAQQMKFAYIEWLAADKRFERVSLEEQLLLQCLVCGAEGIAKSLTEMEQIAVSW